MDDYLRYGKGRTRNSEDDEENVIVKGFISKDKILFKTKSSWLICTEMSLIS